MEEITSHLPGTFCWAELGTIGNDAAKKFYADLFGWESLDIPVGEGMVYTMFNTNGKSQAAVYELSPDMKDQNIPPNWGSYICVESVDDCIAKTKELGGTVILEGMDVMEEGRMGMIQDPEGAILGLWQPKNHIGYSYMGANGSLCWIEHGSHDSSKSIPFLEKLFGWTSKTEQMGDMLYTTFWLGEMPAAGLYIFPPDMSEIPSNWLPYFLIDNIDAGIDKTGKAGGEVLMPKASVPGIGDFAVLRDPQGAVFGLLQADMK